MPTSRQSHQQNSHHHPNAVSNFPNLMLATQQQSAPAARSVNSDNNVPAAPPNTTYNVAAPPDATPNASSDVNCDWMMVAILLMALTGGRHDDFVILGVVFFLFAANNIFIL